MKIISRAKRKGMKIINWARRKEKMLRNGKPPACTFIFVKTQGSWIPEDALKCFGIQNFQRGEPFDRYIDGFWFYDDSEWFHMLEGYLYSLYYQDNFVDTLLKLSTEYDVFWFCVGDCDYSFNYAYYSGGKCTRKFVVASPGYDDRVIEINEGEKLRHEDNILNDNDEIIFSDDKCITVLLDLASGLGIKTKYDESNFQVYRDAKHAAIINNQI